MAAAPDLTALDLAEASARVAAGEVSPVDLTQACLERIERLDGELNAFITVTAQSALAEARAAEAEIAAGRRIGPLHGIPIALKDLIDVEGVRTTGASELYRDRVATQDAEVTRRLRAAGAVFLGKTNLHELAFGASGVVSAHGPVKNPWALRCSAGGSSSGSAVAVATGMCFGAVGTDTGGSIRQPAALCGITGLKPTYGRVSTRGVIPLSVSNDHVGPMARSALDCALLLQAMAGHDPADTHSVDLPVPDYVASSASVSALRIGLPRSHFFAEIAPEVIAAVEAALAALSDVTARRSNIDVPAHLDVTAFRADIYAQYRDAVRRTPELFQPDTLSRIRGGADIDKGAHRDARRKLDELRAGAAKTFDQVDLLVCPTVPMGAFDVEGEWTFEQLRAVELMTLRNTRPFNALGLPALSVPCGFTHEDLPIGLQIVGPPGGEAKVLGLARAYQARTDWHRRRPPID